MKLYNKNQHESFNTPTKVICGRPPPTISLIVHEFLSNCALQTYYLHHEPITADGVRQWFNLTITNPVAKDLGTYLCVAENQGGVMEKEVIFTFDDPNTYYQPITDEQMTIIIGASVAVAVLFLLLLLVCCLCFCRGGKKQPQPKAAKNRAAMEHQRHHQLNNGYNGDSQRLLPNGVSTR